MYLSFCTSTVQAAFGQILDPDKIRPNQKRTKLAFCLSSQHALVPRCDALHYAIDGFTISSWCTVGPNSQKGALPKKF